MFTKIIYMKKVIYILLILFLISCSKQQPIKHLAVREPSPLHYIDDLDTKLYIICSKYEALHLYDDLKGTLIKEIGINNYYSTMQRRMSIVSTTKDTGTCQFQHRTFYYLAGKYNIKNANILSESQQIAIMVLAFRDGKQNWWYGYKKYKNSIE